MFMGHQKGRNTKENIQRNFGMPTPHGYILNPLIAIYLYMVQMNSLFCCVVEGQISICINLSDSTSFSKIVVST